MNISNIDYHRLAELVVNRREESQLSQVGLAELSGLNIRTLSRLERGGVRLKPASLLSLLEALEITEEELPRVAAENAKPKGKNVFISYSHRDKEYLDRLLVHLKPLEKQGLIDSWVDTRLLAGDKWKKEIDKALKQARVAILLVSADFLASDFIIENELPPLLQSAEDSGTLIIPVILKPCRFARDKSLSNFQSINLPEEPLSFVDENERENIYDTIAQRIEQEFE